MSSDQRNISIKACPQTYLWKSCGKLWKKRVTEFLTVDQSRCMPKNLYFSVKIGIPVPKCPDITLIWHDFRLCVVLLPAEGGIPRSGEGADDLRVTDGLWGGVCRVGGDPCDGGSAVAVDATGVSGVLVAEDDAPRAIVGGRGVHDAIGVEKGEGQHERIIPDRVVCCQQHSV